MDWGMTEGVQFPGHGSPEKWVESGSGQLPSLILLVHVFALLRVQFGWMFHFNFDQFYKLPQIFQWTKFNVLHFIPFRTG